jgi:hypothetical protein
MLLHMGLLSELQPGCYLVLPFPFYIVFIASAISLFEGSLVLIGNSGGKPTQLLVPLFL